MSRRLLAIGAHAADFVWRAGGVLALTSSRGGTADGCLGGDGGYAPVGR